MLTYLLWHVITKHTHTNTSLFSFHKMKLVTSRLLLPNWNSLFLYIHIHTMGRRAWIPLFIKRSDMKWFENSAVLVSSTINSMEQSYSWDALRRSVGPETSSVLWNPKFHCRVHSSLSLFPIHSTSYIRSTLILSSHQRLGLQSSLFQSDIVTRMVYAFLNSTMRATCPAHL
jgi:hypothetical protein